MASSLSNLINNLSGGIHEIKCKYRHHDKKFGSLRIRYQHCDCCFNLQTLKIT